MTFNPNEHMTNLKGKQYLEVKWRLVWFRETHTKGRIDTAIISSDPLVVRATIADESGMVLATGHGSAVAKPGAVWSGREIEKAETAAIGRALAHAGFGTQFNADDEDVVDSPVERPQRPTPSPQLVPKSVSKTLDVPVDANGEPNLNVLFDTPSDQLTTSEVKLLMGKAAELKLSAADVLQALDIKAWSEYLKGFATACDELEHAAHAKKVAF